MANTVIESLGTYVPVQSSSTREVMDGCKRTIRFPLEKVTGIKSLPTAGVDEFSIDLAKKAIINCLKNSRLQPAEIDILICCNISRYDGPEKVSFEPGTAIRLKKYFGFSKALVFDITNACAGMFTGIYIIDALIKTGAVRYGMVVSGEYITHLARTAQYEIESFMDPKLACLTLGDAGAALILKRGSDADSGFNHIDIVTLGAYSKYCVAKTTDQPHGGFIMLTDPINLADKGIKFGAKHAIGALNDAGWKPENFQHLIMHQTSTMTINSAQREINSLMNSVVSHSGNTINNLEYRGNSASTSHIVALEDNIRNSRIRSGDKIVFSIGASGLTVGTALYTLDDLPERMGSPARETVYQPSHKANSNGHAQRNNSKRRIRALSIGSVPDDQGHERDSLVYTSAAATKCIEKSGRSKNEIDLIIYSGVYRSDFMLEPAYASLVAGEISANSSSLDSQNKTLAFDIFNGGVGFLNACYVAQQMIGANNCRTVLVVASEFENNAANFPNERLGLKETASAMLLEAAPDNASGFSRFVFSDNTDDLDMYSTYWTNRDGKPYLHIEKDPGMDLVYIKCILPAINKLLQAEGISIQDISMVFPPQISSGFVGSLSESMNLPRKQFVDLQTSGLDYISTSLGCSMEYAQANELVKPGDIGLMICVGSGVQTGCALYYF